MKMEIKMKIKTKIKIKIKIKIKVKIKIKMEMMRKKVARLQLDSKQPHDPHSADNTPKKILIILVYFNWFLPKSKESL